MDGSSNATRPQLHSSTIRCFLGFEMVWFLLLLIRFRFGPTQIMFNLTSSQKLGPEAFFLGGFCFGFWASEGSFCGGTNGDDLVLQHGPARRGENAADASSGPTSGAWQYTT